MFDCVYPTRTAVCNGFRVSFLTPQRFGHAITPRGVLNLRNRIYSTDFSAIDDACSCPCCRKGGWGVTRSLIYHLACKETGIMCLLFQILIALPGLIFSPFITSFTNWIFWPKQDKLSRKIDFLLSFEIFLAYSITVRNLTIPDGPWTL